MKGTIEVSIEEGYKVLTAKLKHDNYYNPIELTVFKNTISGCTAQIDEQGEYKIVFDEELPIGRVWVAKPLASGGKNIESNHSTNYVEFNTENGIDLNGYMDIEIRVYPETP